MTEPLQPILRAFLEDLEDLASEHGELTDTDVREALHRTLTYCVVWGNGDQDLPIHFGMFSDEADSRLRGLVGRFVVEANQILTASRTPMGQTRLDLLQDSLVRTRTGRMFDEFLGSRATPLAPHECREAWTTGIDH